MYTIRPLLAVMYIISLHVYVAPGKIGMGPSCAPAGGSSGLLASSPTLIIIMLVGLSHYLWLALVVNL